VEVRWWNRLPIDGVIRADHGERRLVVEVGALPTDVLLLLGEHPYGRTAAVPPLRALGDPLLCFGTVLLSRAVVSGVGYRLATGSPSAVMRNTCTPTSMPASRPVSGSGAAGTRAREQETYQPSAARLTVTVLRVPSVGRLHRTARRPILARTKHPFSRRVPFPYALEVTLWERSLPGKRGNPGCSPLATRRKKAC